MTDVDPVQGRWPGLAELRQLLARRVVSATELVTAALRRIDEVNPALNAVLAVDPTALAQARDRDRRLAAGSGRPLDGIPVLVKDNIGTAGLATTAGSRTLACLPPAKDSGVVLLLRAAGAVVLGKTNLSEWGNFRCTTGTEGWSGVGGQTRNPYRLDHSPWGSSSGSAAGVAAGLAPAALGTDTDGSITSPAAACGVTGLRPARGLLPADGIVPITFSLDTPGVLAGSVADASYLLAALTGTAIPMVLTSLAGRRIALWPGRRPDDRTRAFVARAAVALREQGADVVTVRLPIVRERLDDGLSAMIAEFAPCLAAYLRSRPGAPSTVEEVLAANRRDPVALSVFGQDLMERAAAVTAEERFRAVGQRAAARSWATGLLDDVLARGFDAIVAPTGPPAWRIDYAVGDPVVATTCTVPALAGRPVVAVPAGLENGLPLSLSVFGPPATWTVLGLAAGVAAAWPPVPPPLVCGTAARPRPR